MRSRIKAKGIWMMWAMLLSNVMIFGQANDSTALITDPIKVLARPSKDSVVLRWAPLSVTFWRAGINHGYIIERYTLARDGKVLAQPERKLLTPTPLKPWPETQWERVVHQNKFVAIAAQALLGETFELDIDQADIMQIVNKSRENEQRFSIALYCADMSAVVARALALYLVDHDVNANEKYLYRISCSPPSSPSLRGSVYVHMDDEYSLPAPLDFTADVDGDVVSMRWNQSFHIGIYTAYQVERSQDGQQFSPISEDPMVVLSNEKEDLKYQYASDTIRDLSKEYYYRVRGLSPFGELGQPTDAIKVKGQKDVSFIPAIISVGSIDNKSAIVEWEYPVEANNDIKGFFVERARSVSGTYKKVHEHPLASEVRTYHDKNAEPTNYYRITVLTNKSDQVRSMPYFMHLIDSVAPAMPGGLQGMVDDLGYVKLSWSPNTDADIFGYRIYRTYYLSEEFTQLTHQPLKENHYQDTVQLQALNEKIHYKVMAIDKNQNHSELSAVLTLSIPDKVPPVSPVFLPIESDEEGVKLSWMRSGSTDVVRYELFRKGEANQWIRLAVIPAGSDSIYHYADNNLRNTNHQVYTVVAVDEASLESIPAEAVVGKKIRKSVMPAVDLQAPVIDRVNGKITLKWAYEEPGIQSFRVYRSVNNEPIKLYRTISAKEFTDQQLRLDTRYTYKIIASFTDGSLSAFSKTVELSF